MKGKVKWYDNKKGYGFIRGVDGKDVFAHRSNLSYFETFLEKGDSTQYNIERTKVGNKAIDIIVLNRLNEKEKIYLH